jgi:hypothetical protein
VGVKKLISGCGFKITKKAYGTQEVIIENTRPFSSIYLTCPLNILRDFLTMYVRRIKAAMALPKVQYILCF